MANIRSMTMKMFCVKNPFFAKNTLFSKKNVSNIYLEIKELQLRLLEKQLMTTFCLFWGKKAFFPNKWWHDQKKVIIALNLYIGTNVLVYDRWLVLKVWYMADWPAQHFRHYINSHCLCM